MKTLREIYMARRPSVLSEFWQRINHPHGLLASFGCLLRVILTRVFYDGKDWEFQDYAPKWVFGLLRLTGVDYSFMAYYREVSEREKARKFYRDASGRWWCETTITPVSLPDRMDALKASIVKSLGVPRHIFVGGRRLGKTELVTRLMEELRQTTGLRGNKYPGLSVIDYPHREKP